MDPDVQDARLTRRGERASMSTASGIATEVPRPPLITPSATSRQGSSRFGQVVRPNVLVQAPETAHQRSLRLRESAQTRGPQK